jgi:hypothetical protein
MKTKEFKLLIVGFNKYLLNENEYSERKRKSSIESPLDFEGSAWNINEARIKERVEKKLGKRNNL